MFKSSCLVVTAVTASASSQGVYVLVDNGFSWIRFFSAPEGQDTRGAVLQYMTLPCGVIRGALASFGLDCIVTVDIATLPTCVYLGAMAVCWVGSLEDWMTVVAC